MRADVTVSVNALPAGDESTYRRDRFEIVGDGKVLRVMTINTDMFGIQEAFKRVRKRARSIQGATMIRYGLNAYNL